MRSEMWARLSQGKPLEGLTVPRIYGRVDLRNLMVREPSVRATTRTEMADVDWLDGVTQLKSVHWKSIDFSGSHLPHLLFFNCTIDDCVFDKCFCQEWGLWGTVVTNTTFRAADLRNSAIGAVEDDKRNCYRSVDFSGADLRGTAYKATEFTGCQFRSARLDKVDFETSTFSACVFAGELREVQFYRTGYKGEAFPPNDMRNVDFTQATLRDVEFRGIDLDTARLPSDADHIVLDHFGEAMDRVLDALQRHPASWAKGLAAYLDVYRRWAGRIGVLNRNDIEEIAGKEGVKTLLELIGGYRRK